MVEASTVEVDLISVDVEEVSAAVEVQAAEVVAVLASLIKHPKTRRGLDEGIRASRTLGRYPPRQNASRCRIATR